MSYDTTRVEDHIIDILNATTLGWGGTLDDARRSAGAITNAREQSQIAVLLAISMNPQNGHWPGLAEYIPVGHNAFLPEHDGEVGIPYIIPFTGALQQDGVPAAPDEIDSYRGDLSGFELYTGDTGTPTPHDQADANGYPSPVAGFYSIINARLKFSGLSCSVPMIQFDRASTDTLTPEAYEPTVVKLSIIKLVKEGDNIFQVARELNSLGESDLQEIRNGSMRVSPVPTSEMVQKMGAI